MILRSTFLLSLAARLALAATLAVPAFALAQQAATAEAATATPAAGAHASAPAPADAAKAPASGQQPAQSGPADTAATREAGPAPQPPATTTAPAQPAPQMFPGPAQAAPSAPAAGSLLQTIVSLLFVLALLVGLAWAMKRFGPRAMGGAANMRVIGALSLGGRERIMVVEVADQWIVVGAAPGRVNVLTTMPRQEGVEAPAPMASGLPSGFADWLKQTIDKRNAK
jgi:flagellar protein FliO/FliZ